MTRYVVLPGLDGTGELHDEFRRASPSGAVCDVVSYPADQCLDYDELVRYVEARLPVDERFVLIGESFSGPVATRVAARFPDRVMALVLCSSFVTPPRSTMLRVAARETLFRLRLPERVLSMLMLSPLATPALSARFTATLRQVQPVVLACRVRALLSVDDRATLRNVRCPVGYLRGTFDRLVPERPLREITAALPSTRVYRIAAPHAILQTAPGAAWACIQELVATG